ncbi:MAG: hypothetical protein P8Y97_18800 [Candidatus Lokiarchaeota archaeon]
MQELELHFEHNIKIKETSHLQKIQYAFEKLLFVPEKALKPKIIHELMSYLKQKLENLKYPLKVFITKVGRLITGIVVCQIDPEYKSYGRKCGTFGWLYALDIESCQLLMEACEQFLKLHKIRKIRGPINYPKLIGGIGFQTKGFNKKMMSGVNYHTSDMRELRFLEELGYKKESKYSCVKVIKSTWEKGNSLDTSIKIEFKNLTGFKSHIEDMKRLAEASFYSILADAPGGDERLKGMVKLFSLIPNTFFQLPEDFNPKDHSNFPLFMDALSCFSSKNELPFVPIAFDRQSGELVGIIISLPNLYQIWKGEPLTDANVDTVIINNHYTGRGIFSALTTVGIIGVKIHNVSYYEGTTIWSNNEKAINTIFPHSKVVREHIVVQKRI